MKKTVAHILLAWALCFTSGCTAPTPTPTPPPVITKPSPPPAAVVVQQLLDGHNQQRTAKGLPPLVIDPELQAAAQGHANFMAQRGQMAHEGIGDGDPFTRIRAQGYSYRAAGENIAWNQQTVQVVMTTWMNSPGHRANILGNYTQAGLAVAYGKRNDPYWSVSFGTPARLTLPVEQHARATIAGPAGSRDANGAASSTSITLEAGR